MRVLHNVFEARAGWTSAASMFLIVCTPFARGQIATPTIFPSGPVALFPTR